MEEKQAIRGTIEGPAGALEVWLEYPKQPLKGVLLVAHPHPLYGGSMSNKVVHTLARAGLNQGWAALRFNFRGVGESEGEHDHGEGEQADLLAVMDWVCDELPGVPVRLAGFSFGARIALMTADEVEPEQLLLVAPPFRLYSDLWGVEQVEWPWAVFMGDADELVPFSDVKQWVEKQQLPPDFQVLEGASHFFHGRLVELREKIETFLSNV